MTLVTIWSEPGVGIGESIISTRGPLLTIASFMAADRGLVNALCVRPVVMCELNREVELWLAAPLVVVMRGRFRKSNAMTSIRITDTFDTTTEAGDGS